MLLLGPAKRGAMDELTFRAGTADDIRATFLIFEEAYADLMRRLGSDEPTSFADPDALERIWSERLPLYEHIVGTAAEHWIAEADGEPIGYGRSVARDGVLQLVELFVKPGVQSSGAGKGLLARCFEPRPASRRLVISSPDVRGLALYLRSGVRSLSPAFYFHRVPRRRAADREVEMVPIDGGTDALATLDAVDREVLGFARAVDHAFLLRDRSGFLFTRRGRPVGYGYCGRRNGPFALLDPAHFAAALAHAETFAAAAGHAHFGIEVPLCNAAAVEACLARGFHMEPFAAHVLGDGAVGQLDRYVITSPPFLV